MAEVKDKIVTVESLAVIYDLLNDKIKKYNPANLLDNSDFRNPINQRCINSGSIVPQYNYFFDRWLTIDSCTIEFNPTGTKVTGGQINQMLDNLTHLVGKSVTVACKFTDGVVLCGSGVVTNTGSWNTFAWCENGNRSVFISNSNSLNLWDFRIACAGATLEWAALYEGEYTVETLPEYKPKGYSAEYAECRRYFRSHQIYTKLPAVITWEGKLEVWLNGEVKMRDVPSVSSCPMNLIVNGNHVNINDKTPEGIHNEHGKFGLYYGGGFDNYSSQPCWLEINSELIISADL
jgi:hypothetical protein